MFSYEAEDQVIGDAKKRFKFDFFNIAIDAALMKLGEHFKSLREHMTVFGFLCDGKNTANLFPTCELEKLRSNLEAAPMCSDGSSQVRLGT